MIVKRFFSAEPSKRLFSDILKDNSGTIVALGAIASGAFGIGLYVNQMKVVEEKINTVKALAEERSKKDNLLAEEKLNALKMESKKDNLLAEEKLNTVRMEGKKEVMEAKKEALENLYQIFTQQEFKDAKKTMMAQKDKMVNIK
jgi:hypothetical protein